MASAAVIGTQLVAHQMTDSIATYLPRHTLQDCKGSNHCLSVCAKSCAKPQTIVNGEQCKRYGTDSSHTAAKQACDNALVSEAVVHVHTSTPGPIPPKCISGSDLLETPADSLHVHVHRPANLPQLYCNGGQQRISVLGARRYFPVSLGQCANIAYGTCQEHGMTRWRSPCWYAFNGYRSCNKDAFMKFYTGERGHRWQHMHAASPRTACTSNNCHHNDLPSQFDTSRRSRCCCPTWFSWLRPCVKHGCAVLCCAVPAGEINDRCNQAVAWIDQKAAEEAGRKP